MKKVYTWCLATSLLALVFSSCSRSVNMPDPIITTDTSFERQTFVRNLDSTVLTLTIQPKVLCYTYPNGEPPASCTIMTEMTSTLSKPVMAHVRIELQRLRVVEMADSTGQNAADAPETTIVLNISPGQTRVIFNANPESYTAGTNIRDKYKLLTVSVYQPMN